MDDVGQDRARHAEQLQQLRIPVALWMLNSSVRDALATVGDVRGCRDRCQTSQVSTVPKASSPTLGAPARARDVVEDPGELGAGEVGIEHQPGALLNQALERRLP